MAVLLLIVASIVAIAGFDGRDATAGPVAATLVVEGPDGLVWAGDVHAEHGTAFHVLIAGADEGNFPVEWSGAAGNRFVHTVGGIDSSSGGWCAQVAGMDSHLSVDRFPVEDGQHVRWYWTADQCERF